MAEVASQTLDAVAREIVVSLGEARVALENHVEQPDDPRLLQRCAAELQLVQGVLRMLEIHGAALLAEEMVQVVRYLLATAQERKNRPEALDALMRAMVQLPGYLERVMAGGRDLALVLLPLLNDMRAVRGSSLLSEGTLLLLNLKSDRQAAPTPHKDGEEAVSVAQWARKLRARFQVGLIGWIRGERVDQNLDLLAGVAMRLEQVATLQPVFQLWWVTGAVIESLRERGLEGGVSIKRLLGLADRELRRLFEQGEGRYSQSPPVELLNNLLYYVARSTSSGPRVSAVRSSFRLAELLPVDESIEQERESLSAPSVKLMHTVAAAIREDLSKIKDVLDIFVRRGSGLPDELAPQVELLRKIGDTLGVLGLGELRASIQGEIAHLEKFIASRERPTDAQLVQIAATLIGVEDRLDDQLVGLILPRKAGPAAPAEEADFQQVQSAVLRECIVNLARVKEYVTQNVGGTLEASGFDNWHELMRGIQAGLLMLGKSRAVDVIERISMQLRRVMQPGGTGLPADALDRLADAIVSTEYYMETLQAGRGDPWYMLDNAEGALEALDAQPPRGVPTVAAASASLRILRPELTQPQVAAEVPAAPEALAPVNELAHSAPAELAASGRHLIQAPVLAPQRAPAVVEQVDPELISLFLEEAREEVAKIEQQFPMWDQNPLDEETLINVRRSFHTLKGSGRMVGARELGEFSWAIENLVNRLLDKTLTRSQPILGTLRDAVRALPELVEQLATAAPPVTDVVAIATRAHALAAGRDGDSVANTVSPQPPYAPASAEGDPTMLAIHPQPVVEGAMPPPPQPLPVIENDFMLAPALEPEPLPMPAPLPMLEPQPAMEPFAVDPMFADVFGAEPGLHEPGPAEPVAAEPELVPDPAMDAAFTMEAMPNVAATDFFSSLFAEPTPPPLEEGGARIAASAPESALSDEENTLRDIYARETSTHVGTVRRWLTRERPLPSPHRLTEEVYRACHTLSGSSQMAAARHGIRFAEPLNDWLRRSFDSNEGLIDSDLDVLSDCMSALEDVSQHMDEATGFFVLHQDLPTRIAQADAALQRRIAAAEMAEQRLQQSGLFQALDHARMEQAAAESVANIDYDPEIAGIFSDEATELLEAAEAALLSFGADRNNREALDALKRPLHTLKGGARMASVMAMGDLAHELESFVLQIEMGTVPADARAQATAQATLDELARMRELLASGRPVAPAHALIARIHGVEPESGEATMPAVEALTLPDSDPALQAEPALAQFPASGATADLPGFVPPVEHAPHEPVEAASFDAPPTDDIAPVHGEPTHDGSYALPGLPAAESGPVTQDAPAFVAPAAPFAAPPPPPVTTIAASAIPHPPAPALVPPGREPVAGGDRQEMARVDAELLNTLLNNAGEVSIGRSRVEQQLGSIEFNLGELSRTVIRLKEQLRKLEIETEKQILHRHETEGARRTDFDPLELDRYSTIQQFSRALAETANDVASIQQLLETMTQDTQNHLQQQARTITELQNGLMRTRMVSFQRHVQRLSRIVRQAATDTGRQAELVVEGATGELDRQVLERMLPPFEHMLRNAVVHGIESREQRRAAGKPEIGQIKLTLRREGAEVIVDIADDGAGMNLNAIRGKGLELGLIQPEQTLSDEDAMQLVLEPGFSTASSITQAAGRGVGMDVVATEIKKLGGALHMETTAGQGSHFIIRLPFTLAVSHALVARIGEEHYALPLPTVEGVVRLSRSEVAGHLASDAASFTYSGQKYRFQPLGLFVGLEPSPLPEQDVTMPVVLVRAGEHSTGLVVDELIGSREIVVKSVGPQIAAIRGISGATILGDGRIVVILDIGALVRSEWRSRNLPLVPREKTDRRVFVLVVDDSITVRRVTQRLLERNGMRVATARDGMDAMSLMQEQTPDIILLDIEMPRMDGYEVAAQVRGDPRLEGIPIIMITSRAGEKHRARAIELGVNDYLGKPYQESQLLDAIEPLVAGRTLRGGRDYDSHSGAQLG